MYGLKSKGGRFHLNYREVWTEIKLPDQEGKWKIFNSKKSAQRYLEKYHDPAVAPPLNDIVTVKLS